MRRQVPDSIGTPSGAGSSTTGISGVFTPVAASAMPFPTAAPIASARPSTAKTLAASPLLVTGTSSPQSWRSNSCAFIMIVIVILL